jgi:hypothetical protein
MPNHHTLPTSSGHETARSYPVSNRGRGGPAHRQFVSPASPKLAVPMMMLGTQSPKPRSALKRKLPCMSQRQATEETLSESDDSSSVEVDSSKRTKLDAALSSNDDVVAV